MRRLNNKILAIALFFSISVLPCIGADRYVGGSFTAGVASNFSNVNYCSASLSLSPEYGYVLSDKWIIGAKFQFGISAGGEEKKISFSNGTVSRAICSTENLISLGITPYARYRCYNYKSLSLWAEGDLNIIDNFTDSKSTGAFSAGASVNPVVIIDLTSKVSFYSGLEFLTIGCSYNSVSGTDSVSFGMAVNSALNLGDITIGVLFKL